MAANNNVTDVLLARYLYTSKKREGGESRKNYRSYITSSKNFSKAHILVTAR